MGSQMSQMSQMSLDEPLDTLDKCVLEDYPASRDDAAGHKLRPSNPLDADEPPDDHATAVLVRPVLLNPAVWLHGASRAELTALEERLNLEERS